MPTGDAAAAPAGAGEGPKTPPGPGARPGSAPGSARWPGHEGAPEPAPGPAPGTPAGPAPGTPAGVIAEGHAFTGPALDLGALLWDGSCLPGAPVRVPLGVLNRHGLVAGATGTGTGKTKTLQLVAEQLSAAGVPVFLADIKGDLSGISAPGTGGDRVTGHAAEVGQQWTPAACPCEFCALGGLGAGIPLRATVTSFGPALMSKVLGLDPTQEQSLGLIFHYADTKGLELVDLKDLRAVGTFLTADDAGKSELRTLGGISAATAGVILRTLTAFEAQGAGAFFGEPEFDTGELLRTAADGRGIVSVLELPEVQDRPQLFSTFLMWLLADLFEDLPEVGDPDRPKLVFFLDEAHLLFNGASKAFRRSRRHRSRRNRRAHPRGRHPPPSPALPHGPHGPRRPRRRRPSTANRPTRNSRCRHRHRHRTHPGTSPGNPNPGSWSRSSPAASSHPSPAPSAPSSAARSPAPSSAPPNAPAAATDRPRARKDPPRTRQSPPTLAAFRPWGSSVR